jgi:hypothetical protein
LLIIFYGGLSNQERLLLDAATGGSLCERGIEEGFRLIDTMASNQSQYQKPREDPAYLNAKTNKVEGDDRLLAEIAAIHKKIDGLSINSVNSNPPPSSTFSQLPSCALCGGMTIYLSIAEWL